MPTEGAEDGPEEKRAAAVCFAVVRGTHFRWRGMGTFGLPHRVKEQRWQRLKRVRKVNEVRESWLAMVNGWDPVRRRSCGGEKGETLRRGWDREVGEFEGAAFWLCCGRDSVFGDLVPYGAEQTRAPHI